MRTRAATSSHAGERPASIEDGRAHVDATLGPDHEALVRLVHDEEDDVVAEVVAVPRDGLRRGVAAQLEIHQRLARERTRHQVRLAVRGRDGLAVQIQRLVTNAVDHSRGFPRPPGVWRFDTACDR